MSHYPKVVMLHDIDHGDFWQLQQAVGLDAPLSIVSHTDMKQQTEIPSRHLAILAKDVDDADHVFVHDALLDPLTEASRTAINQAFLSDKMPPIISFDNCYRPGHDVLELLRLSTEEVVR